MGSIFALLRELFFMLGYVKTASGFPKPLGADEERSAIEALSRGDEQARRTLIEHNLRLVAHIAKKYAAGRDMDDLVSIGTIGLIKAVSTYDPAKGSQLVTYASRCIQNEILMSIRAQKKRRSEVYLQEPIGSDSEGNELCLLDVLVAQDEDVDETVIRSLRLGRIRELVSSLNAREQIIMTLRYGLDGGVPLTQKQVGQKLGLSRSYVSRIEKKAIGHIAEKLKA